MCVCVCVCVCVYVCVCVWSLCMPCVLCLCCVSGVAQQRAGEDILWSADVILYEDELHDHGAHIRV